MQQDRIQFALKRLADAFPTFPGTPGTRAEYIAALERLDSAEALEAAVSDWLATEDRFPTINQLLHVYHGAQRRLAHARALEGRETARALPAAPPIDAIERLDVIRSALEEAVGSLGDRGHQHPKGQDPLVVCPTCRQGERIAEQMQARIAQLRAARGV